MSLINQIIVFSVSCLMTLLIVLIIRNRKRIHAWWMSDYDYLEEERSNEQGTLEPNLETLGPSLKRLEDEGSNENVSGKPRGLTSKMRAYISFRIFSCYENRKFCVFAGIIFEWHLHTVNQLYPQKRGDLSPKIA